jgi:hypothetical protein
MLKHLFGVHAVVRDGDCGNYGVLPRIEVVNLGHGQVESLSQTILQALEYVAFLLEGMRVLDVDLKREHTDDGLSHGLIMTAIRPGAHRRRSLAA